MSMKLATLIIKLHQTPVSSRESRRPGKHRTISEVVRYAIGEYLGNHSDEYDPSMR